MSALALFLVLGGGLAAAAALSGSGRVKAGGLKGVEVGSFKTVLSLPGIGKIQADCGKSVGVRFKNTSGQTLQATLVVADIGFFDAAALADKASLEVGVGDGPDGLNTVRFHVFRATARGKPSAEITVSNRYAPDQDCATMKLVAQALTAE